MHWQHHHGINGNQITAIERKNKSWVLKDAVWDQNGYLKLTVPGESYSVLLFRNKDNHIRYWYINLEDSENPMHRTLIGFDCTDMILDVIIEPDFQHWHWEDEDELQEAINLGLISPEQSQVLYTKGAESEIR